MKRIHTTIFAPAILLFAGTSFATTWTVDDDGKADFDNIQAAVDASSDGDEIIVMPGIYTSTADEVVNMLGKAVWLHSSDGPEVTIVNGEDVRRGILCNGGETSKTIIEGLTITQGNAGLGGGMFNYQPTNQDVCDPTLIDCRFLSNAADKGAAGCTTTAKAPPR